MEQDANEFDIAVIGAGLHGASIAAEAASRGLKTLLVQAGQVGGTSSSTPGELVDIGLQQLEQFQVADVMANFHELTLLQSKAPHLVRPTTTFIVENLQVRSRRRVKIGVKLFHRLQPGKLPCASMPDQKLTDTFTSNTLFAEPIEQCIVSYTRFIIAIIQQLTTFSSLPLLEHRVVGATRDKSHWQLNINDMANNQIVKHQAKIVVNCAGCLADEILRGPLGVKSRTCADTLVSAQIFIKGQQHWQNAVILQAKNKPLITAHSFDNEHLCVGPIVAADNDENSRENAIAEFIALWNSQANTPLYRRDIVCCRWYSRPLVEDPTSNHLRRMNESFLDLNNPGFAAPLLSLFGSNFFQHRKVAEQALDILEAFTHKKKNPMFSRCCLPGGDFESRPLSDILKQLQHRYTFLKPNLIQRLLFTYGTNALEILNGAKAVDDLGQHFGHGLYEREVQYLLKNEWARSATDILWRRTYLGVKFNAQQVSDLGTYLAR